MLDILGEWSAGPIPMKETGFPCCSISFRRAARRFASLKSASVMRFFFKTGGLDILGKFSVPLIQLGHDGFNGGFTNAILP